MWERKVWTEDEVIARESTINGCKGGIEVEELGRTVEGNFDIMVIFHMYKERSGLREQDSLCCKKKAAPSFFPSTSFAMKMKRTFLCK